MTHLPVPHALKSRASSCHPYPYTCLHHSTETRWNAGENALSARVFTPLPCIDMAGSQYRKQHHTFSSAQTSPENFYHGQTQFSVGGKSQWEKTWSDQQVEDATNFVMRNIHLGLRIDGVSRKDFYESPMVYASVEYNQNSRKENSTGVKSKETKGTCDAFIMVDDQICQVKESTCP